jgi:hypothetical protein
MSRPLLPPALAAALLLAAVACWAPDLPWLDGKACDDAHPCVRGVCLASQCVISPPGRDASTPVLVTRSVLHALDDGTVISVPEAPADLDMLVETTGGGFVALQPAVADGGLMVFWDAPPPGQPYLLRLGSRHFASDAGAVDLSERALGRPGLTAPSPGTALRTQLNCLSSWDPLDELQLTAAGAGLAGLDLTTLPGWTTPPTGSNQLNISVSWTTAATPGLVQTTQGDLPIYIQLEHNSFNRGLTDGGLLPVDWWRSKKSRSGFELIMQDGAEALVPASECVKDLNSKSAGNIVVHGSEFGTHLAETGRGATMTGVAFTIRQAVWPAGPGPGVYRATWDSADDVALSLQLPDVPPFIGAWAHEASAVMTAIVPVDLQLDAGTTTAFEKVVLATRRAWPLDGGELAPALSPPRFVMVNGEDASSGATSTGVQPEVTWTEPALGTPAAYEVSVWREQDPSRQKAPRLEGTVWTDVPRVRIPPGLMSPRSTYVLHVRAVSAPMDPLRAPLRSGLPYDEAETVTGLIEP